MIEYQVIINSLLVSFGRSFLFLHLLLSDRSLSGCYFLNSFFVLGLHNGFAVVYP